MKPNEIMQTATLRTNLTFWSGVISWNFSDR